MKKITIASDDDVRVRLMRDIAGDYRLVARWLTDPRVLEFYEGRDNPHDFDRVKEKYAPRVQADEGIVPCIIELASPSPLSRELDAPLPGSAGRGVTGRGHDSPLSRELDAPLPGSAGRGVARWRPVGYLQYYLLQQESFEEYRIDPAEAAYGIDLFIGEPELWGRGLGTRALRAVVRYLFDELLATIITIDPYLINPRAIRAYEKAGFRKVQVLPKHWLHEGVMQDSWLMVIRKD